MHFKSGLLSFLTLLVLGSLGCGTSKSYPPDRVKLHSGSIIEGRIISKEIIVTSKMSGNFLKKVTTVPIRACKKMSFSGSGKVNVTRMAMSYKKGAKGKKHARVKGTTDTYKLKFRPLEGPDRSIPLGSIQWIRFGRGYPVDPKDAEKKK